MAASVIFRKVGPDGNRSRMYWTGKAWSATPADALEFETREEALPEHAKLIASQEWPKGENPLVADKRG